MRGVLGGCGIEPGDAGDAILWNRQPFPGNPARVASLISGIPIEINEALSSHVLARLKKSKGKRSKMDGKGQCKRCCHGHRPSDIEWRAEDRDHELMRAWEEEGEV